MEILSYSYKKWTLVLNKGNLKILNTKTLKLSKKMVLEMEMVEMNDRRI